MHDNFLQRLRKEPPTVFARELRMRLRRQERLSIAPSRFRTFRHFVIAFAIVGSAYAGAFYAMRREIPAQEPGTVQNVVSAPAPDPMRAAIPDYPRERTRLPADELVASPPESQAVRASNDTPLAVARETGPATVVTRSDNGGSQSTAVSSAGAAVVRGRTAIRIVAADALYDETRWVAQRFAAGQFALPEIERSNSGDEFLRFCKGVGWPQPDILVATRRITRAELNRCADNGVARIVESKFGYRAAVVRATTGGPRGLTSRDIFLALAKQIPDPANPGQLVENTNQTWQQVNPKLEAKYIEIFGPAGASALHKDFVEGLMEDGCRTFAWIDALQRIDPTRYASVCHTLRTDRTYIETGETNDLIPQKMGANPDAVSIVSYDFFKRNETALAGDVFSGTGPVLERINAGSYPGSRTLYLYFKKEHGVAAGSLQQFVSLFLSDRTIGPSGMIAMDRFIRLEEAERRAVRADAAQMKELKFP